MIGSGWFKGDTILLSIGQGYLLVTPLQIANLYAAIANKGRYILRISEGIKDSKEKATL